MANPLWDLSRDGMEENILVTEEEGENCFWEVRAFKKALYWVPLNMTCQLYTKEGEEGCLVREGTYW
jgi:hypothetical protein